MWTRSAKFWKPWTLAGWAMLAVVLLTPATVRASCGDYLAHRDHSASNSATKRTADANSMAFHLEEEQAPRPKAPCHGPNCGRPPLVPILPASGTTPSIELFKWACAPAPLSPPHAAEEELAHSPTLIVERRTVQRVERPPRALCLIAA
jgi:hypothetical protein